MSGRSASRRGFSLVEALVALTILSLAIVGGLAAFAGQLRAAASANTALVLEALAREKLSELVLLPAHAVSPLPDSLRKGRFAPPFEAYAWMRSVRPLLGRPDLYYAAVEVRGTESRFSLETRLYRPRTRTFRP